MTDALALVIFPDNNKFDVIGFDKEIKNGRCFCFYSIEKTYLKNINDYLYSDDYLNEVQTSPLIHIFQATLLAGIQQNGELRAVPRARTREPVGRRLGNICDEFETRKDAGWAHRDPSPRLLYPIDVLLGKLSPANPITPRAWFLSCAQCTYFWRWEWRI